MSDGGDVLERDRREQLAPGAVRYPDFFIVGAPRTGTTFLYEHLRQHPQIFMPGLKEPQFFATDLDSGGFLESITFVRERERYLDLFRDARPDQITGEGSTWYLYSAVAALAIQAVNPEARIIMMLRDPVQMLYSLHGRRYYAGSEDIADFRAALEAEEDRRAGRRIPPRARNVKALLYRDVGRYSEQVKRYFDAFGRDRCHVIIFEEFVRDPKRAYLDTLRFLGVDDAFMPDMKVVNAGAARRSQRLQHLLLSPRVVRIARLIVPQRARPVLGRAWDRINSRGQRRVPLDPRVAAGLRADLAPDVERLSAILGRDLGGLWHGRQDDARERGGTAGQA